MSRRKNANEKALSSDANAEIGYHGGRSMVEAKSAGVFDLAVFISQAAKFRGNAAFASEIKALKDRLWDLFISAWEHQDSNKIHHLANAVVWLKGRKPTDQLRIVLCQEIFRRQVFELQFGQHAESYWKDLTRIYEEVCKEEGMTCARAKKTAKAKVDSIRAHDAAQKPRNASEIQSALAKLGHVVTTRSIRDVAWHEFGLRLAPRGSPKGVQRKPPRRAPK